MKIALFAALALAASLSSAFAQTRTLTMSGEGEVQAVPDMVTLSAGVTSEAPSAAAALATNSAHMQSVFAALKKLGVADKDIQTENFAVSPQMTGGVSNQTPHITGYQARNGVRVRLYDVSKLGSALDALVTAGANQMNGVSFGIKDPKPLLAEARAAAVADAKEKAQIYAKAAGVSLGSILSISENGFAGPRPLGMEQVMVSASRVAPTAAGEQTVSATVSIVWILQ